MSNEISVEALDRTMRDLSSTNSPMVVCIRLFFGYLRQILPVVTKGTGDEIILH